MTAEGGQISESGAQLNPETKFPTPIHEGVLRISQRLNNAWNEAKSLPDNSPFLPKVRGRLSTNKENPSQFSGLIEVGDIYLIDAKDGSITMGPNPFIQKPDRPLFLFGDRRILSVTFTPDGKITQVLGKDGKALPEDMVRERILNILGLVENYLNQYTKWIKKEEEFPQLPKNQILQICGYNVEKK